MNKLKSERAERLEKLKKIEQLGINPYPAEAKRTHKTAEVLKDFNLFFKSKKKVFVCGRIRLMRVHGNLSFLELQDESGKIQIALTKKKLGEKYKRFVKIFKFLTSIVFSPL